MNWKKENVEYHPINHLIRNISTGEIPDYDFANIARYNYINSVKFT